MIKNILRLGIGLGILLYLVYFFDFRAVINAISAADPVLLMLSLLVYSFTFLILTIRWRIILSTMDIAIPLSCAYQALAGSVLLSDLTPSRLGAFARPYLARQYMDVASGLTSVVFDKYVDISTVLFLSVIGSLLFYLKGMVGSNTYYLFIWFLLLLVIFFFWSIVLWSRRRQAMDFFSNICIFLHIHPLRILAKFDESMERIKNPARLLVLCLFFTFFAWVTHALRIALIAYAVGYSPPFVFLIFLLPLASALSLVPISLSGLGFVEAGTAAILSLFGVPLYAGISIALLDRVLTFIFHALTGSKYAMDL